METVVVVESGSDAEARASVKGPRESCGGFAVDDNGASHGTKQCFVIVERAVEVFPSGDGSGKGGLVEKVKGEFYLGEKFVPEVVWEAVGYAG